MSTISKTKRKLLNDAWYKGHHPCRLKDFLAGCHCEDCIKIYHPEEEEGVSEFDDPYGHDDEVHLNPFCTGDCDNKFCRCGVE